ncbi:MAG: biopolymer transporter ExbD [Thermoguttaceae bacterium]|nr:biopolymer transporter ExbD [Thermoguttaceae bacterium]
MIPPSELKPKPAKMNLTPMIDVVFLLIIFFVVSNTMMQRERSMPIDLPSAAAADDDTESQTGKIIINIDAAGKLYYGAAEVTGEELKNTLQRERQRSALPLEVRIRCDRTVPYSRIEPVLTLCAEAQIADISFAVISPQP